MREDYRRLPKVLKKNIVCRIGLGLAFLTGFILLCIFSEHLIFALAPGAFAMFMLMDGIGMLFRCLSGEYVELEGVCSEVSKSALRRKTKHIMLETVRGAVKLPTKLRPQSVKVGDHVTVYVPDYASVYEVNGSMVVCEFYGFEVIKGKGE